MKTDAAGTQRVGKLTMVIDAKTPEGTELWRWTFAEDGTVLSQVR